jgi:hypothetical protein
LSSYVASDMVSTRLVCLVNHVLKTVLLDSLYSKKVMIANNLKENPNTSLHDVAAIMLCVCVLASGYEGVTVMRVIPIASNPPLMASPPYPGACSTTPPDPLGGV